MPTLRMRAVLLVPIMAACMTTGCGGDDPSAPRTGGLEVIVRLQGVRTDFDGVMLRIGEARAVRLAVSAAKHVVLVEALPPGQYDLVLEELADGCWMPPWNPTEVRIPVADLAHITLDFRCEDVGAAVPGSALAPATGIWYAERWEIRDPDDGALIDELIDAGWRAVLVINDQERATWYWDHWLAESEYQFLTRYAGELFVEDEDVRATARLILLSHGCFWGDCDGPLHGRLRFDLEDDRLVIRSLERLEWHPWTSGVEWEVERPPAVPARATIVMRRIR